MKFGPDEPPSMCDREDCRIEDRGGTMTLQQQITVYDKQGNPVPAGPNRAKLHRHCRTCGADWTVDA